MVSAFYYDKGDFMPMQQDALALEVAAFCGREAALLLVCDGIGGLPEGEFASSYVSMRLRGWFYDAYLEHIRKRHSTGRIRRDVTGTLYSCNQYLQRYGERHGIKLGTTLTMAVFWERKYQLFHVGDSRAFLLGYGCRQLTRDDSFSGNMLCKCIGSFPWKGVYCKTGVLRRRQRLLLCSDGFWRGVWGEELVQSFGGRKKLSESQMEKRLCKLGQAGRERGEKDNQAAVIIG